MQLTSKGKVNNAKHNVITLDTLGIESRLKRNDTQGGSTAGTVCLEAHFEGSNHHVDDRYYASFRSSSMCLTTLQLTQSSVVIQWKEADAKSAGVNLINMAKLKNSGRC